MKFSDSVATVKGVGEKRKKQLNKLDVYTVEDLLYLFPRRYVDFSSAYEISAAPFDTPCCVKATVLSVSPGVRVKGGKIIFKVICADNTARLTLTYFNSEYTIKKLIIGKDYIFYGKVSGNFLNREMLSPVFISADTPVKMQSVYPLTQGISSQIISNYIHQVLEEIKYIPDFLPDFIVKQFNLPSLDFAIRNIHFAKNPQDAYIAKERLIFDEFFLLQLGMDFMGENKNAKTKIMEDTDFTPFIKSLPFSPTDAQIKVMREMAEDFSKGTAQNRLIQGDVGCGKTIVAACGCYIAAKNKLQSCVMAPTEILAVQHYELFKKLFEPLNINVGLLTASTKAKEKKEILSLLKTGQIQILIGTHAVINENVVFDSLALCITDEQHRFGVKQRGKMALKGENPHIIVMSATPIPRTLAMIIYGNMQISIIDQMPKGRIPIQTYFVGTDKRARMFGFIDKHIKMGRQAYIVLPAIDPGENVSELQNVNEYYNNVIKKLLPNAKSEILHGKMSAKAKDDVMARFKDGEIDLLCSTTVVEVGVDVPNAVIMVIENADRYGLSALHQLRGRVGRGSFESFCILVSDTKSEKAANRLKFLCSSTDGFKISQYDLETRGPGDFFGSRQHGLPQLKIADMAQDISTLKKSQEACKMVLDMGDLNNHPLLQQKISSLFKDLML